MTTLERTALGGVVAAGVGAALFGIGTGVAEAAPGVGPGMFSQDHGHGWGGGDDWHGHRGHDDGWRGGGDWGRGWGGPGPRVYFNPPCATGPLGYVTVCA